MEDADLILVAKYIVTLNELNQVLENGAIAIRDGIIVEVGREEEIRAKYKTEEVIERRHHIVIPGLVDCHTHTQQYLLRSLITDQMLQLPPVWTKILVPFERTMDRKLARISTQASIINMLKNGITYFVEAGAPYPDVLAEEVLNSGIKGVVTLATYDIAEGKVAEPEDVLNEIAKLYGKYGKVHGNLRMWMSIRQVMMSSEKLVDDVIELSRKLGLGLTMHLCEYQGEVDYTLTKYGKRPLEFMVERGLGDVKPVIIAHGVFLSPVELDLVRKYGFGVCWCPTVDSWLMGFHWAGFTNIQDLKIGIGSDGGAWNRLDLLHEVKVAKALGKALSNSIFYYKASMDSKSLLRMLTGFTGEMIGEKIGRIEKGYSADLVLLNFKKVKLLPVFNPLDLIVNYMEGQDVTDVVINGKFVVRENRVTTIDEEKLVNEILNYEQTLKSTVEELIKRLPLH